MRIIIASKNPVKIDAAHYGFTMFFPNQEIQISGVSVPSGVADQPMSERETLTGARNRVDNARRAHPDADFWIGIEGGIDWSDDRAAAFAWVVIVNRSGKKGEGRTGSFFLPDALITLIKQGKELGEADDIIFQQQNSKQKDGTIGNLTRGNITRTSYYQPAVVFALIPFVNPELYE